MHDSIYNCVCVCVSDLRNEFLLSEWVQTFKCKIIYEPQFVAGILIKQNGERQRERKKEKKQTMFTISFMECIIYRTNFGLLQHL